MCNVFDSIKKSREIREKENAKKDRLEYWTLDGRQQRK